MSASPQIRTALLENLKDLHLPAVPLDFGKCPRGCGHPGTRACRHPLALVEAPTPNIYAAAAFVLPVPYQLLQLTGHGGNDGYARHTRASGAYLCAWNQI